MGALKRWPDRKLLLGLSLAGASSISSAYGMSYYGIPNFLQAFARVDYRDLFVFFQVVHRSF
ncbi:hypothetical protein SAMN05216600_102384 [Pseudomonas cuatrocienegasensis]|uniref:Uncharacterized protein n=1 Tax=Pseudomonas cuatrocienegasensis TaxID=543360 RepID=A0ABY1B5K6_9PSED|nr:hypothetical protein SAMN05216600_102384 [Pseudomonas cuatrocienegasensis]